MPTRIQCSTKSVRRRVFSRRSPWISVWPAFALSAVVHAQQVTVAPALSGAPSTFTSWTNVLPEVQMFDPNLGRLTQVQVNFTATVLLDSPELDLNSPPESPADQIAVNVGIIVGQNIYSSVPAAGVQGLAPTTPLDFQTTPASTLVTIPQVYTSPVVLAALTGTGTANVFAEATIFGSGYLPTGSNSITGAEISPQIVQYTYVTIPEPAATPVWFGLIGLVGVCFGRFYLGRRTWLAG